MVVCRGRKKSEEEEEVTGSAWGRSSRGERNVKDGLIVQGSKAGKERNIALRSEEMRIFSKSRNATAGAPNSIFPAAFLALFDQWLSKAKRMFHWHVTLKN